MFSLLKKKRPTMLDALIIAMYGPNPPKKTADLKIAIHIAKEQLLTDKVPISAVGETANGLFGGRIPYSTHDLAIATALSFFNRTENRHLLQEEQLQARFLAAEWAKAGKLNAMLAATFEEALYKNFGNAHSQKNHENSKVDEPHELWEESNLGKANRRLAYLMETPEFLDFKAKNRSASFYKATSEVAAFVSRQRNQLLESMEYLEEDNEDETTLYPEE